MGETMDESLVFLGQDNNVMIDKTVREVVFERKVDCILCMDDNICLNVLHILQKRQISIPQTIRIAFTLCLFTNFL